MSGIAAGILEVVSLVGELGPMLVNDVGGLSTLYSNASNAVQNAAPDGTVAEADWQALRTQESALRSALADEAQQAEQQAASVAGAAQP